MRVRIALSSCTLLLLLVALSGHSASAQVAARPAPAPTPPDMHALVDETVVDASIPDDKPVDKMLEAYAPKVRALDQAIGKLKGDLRKGGMGAGSIGNFVATGIREEASRKLGVPIPLAVTNNGGLRKSEIGEGDLRVRDIFELLPFENALVAFDLTGKQVIDLLRIVVSHGDAQSGARIKYRRDSDKKTELASARLLVDGQEKEIDPVATYTVISIDYLLKVTGGDYTILHDAKNVKPLGLTIRDAMIDYVKSETAAGREIRPTLDGRFILDKSSTERPEQPQ
ncbi:MAG: 5'-nucleotidase C-terminal domain-containing protein [bacterium]